MTSLLRVFADASERVIDLAAPAATHRGASTGASDDVVRLALALRAAPGGPTSGALLFVPASSGMVRATRELQRVHATVMGFVLDVRVSPGGGK